jgi:hypothetical protein
MHKSHGRRPITGGCRYTCVIFSRPSEEQGDYGKRKCELSWEKCNYGTFFRWSMVVVAGKWLCAQICAVWCGLCATVIDLCVTLGWTSFVCGAISIAQTRATGGGLMLVLSDFWASSEKSEKKERGQRSPLSEMREAYRWFIDEEGFTRVCQQEKRRSSNNSKKIHVVLPPAKKKGESEAIKFSCR